MIAAPASIARCHGAKRTRRPKRIDTRRQRFMIEGGWRFECSAATAIVRRRHLRPLGRGSALMQTRRQLAGPAAFACPRRRGGGGT
jgi:hypothetical protein